MDFGIYAGDTDKTIYLRLRDSTTGLAKTGLAYNSAGAVCSYVLPGAARAAITLATQTVTGSHSDGGFVEVDATNCKGLYRLDLPDAAIASGDFTLISIEFDDVIEESVQIPLHTRKVNVDEWSGTAVTLSSGSKPEVDVDTISSDALDDIETSATSACATSLATYDGPTKAEMDSGFAALNDVSAADVSGLLYSSGAAKAYRNTYYVDPAGNDGNDGSSGSPWLTITYALTQIVDGDRVLVNDGTYTERIIANGVYETGVTIEAANKHGALIQQSSNNYCWEFDGGVSKGWTIKGFAMKPADGLGGADGSFFEFDDSVEDLTIEGILFTPPDDAASTANGLANFSGAYLRNITIKDCEADLEGEMGFIRFQGDVRDIYILNNIIENHVGGVDIDDYSGEILLEGNVFSGANRNIGLRTPNKTGSGHAFIGIRGNDLTSTGADGIRVDGSSDWRPVVEVTGNTINADEAGIELNEYLTGGKVNSNTIKAGATPALAIGNAGFTGRVGNFEVLRNFIECTGGRGLYVGYACEGATIQFNTVKASDQGASTQGRNISILDNVFIADEDAALVIKGGTNIDVHRNTMRVAGTTGDYGLQVRYQDAGTYAERVADDLRITGNKIYVSGSGCVGFDMEATNQGTNIQEDANQVFTKDSATPANILGTTVTDTAGWNAAYSGYALTRNGLFTTVNEGLGDIYSSVSGLNDPTASAVAEAILSYNVQNLEGSLTASNINSLAETIMMALNGDRSDGLNAVARKFADNSTFNSRSIVTDANANPVTKVD